MNFNFSFKAETHVTKHWNTTLLTQLIQRVKVLLLAKRNAKMARVHGQLVHRRGISRRWGKMADQLVAEEIERDPVIVSSSQLATQLAHIKSERIVEVVRRDGEVKDVATLSHESS
jgi:hypothetical protein